MDWLAKQKAAILYDFIDSSGGFYNNNVSKNSRSRLNVIFIILNNNKPLTKKFIEESTKAGLLYLVDKQINGGLQASIYNGMPIEGVIKLRDFMAVFQKANQFNSKI